MEYINLIDFNPLTSGETRSLNWGMQDSTYTIMPVEDYTHFIFNIKTELAANLYIQGSNDPGFTYYENYISMYVIAATAMTSYDLPDPMNSNGHVAICWPFMRIQLIDAATSAHSYTRVYFKLWRQ